MTGFGNREGECLLRGTDWAFKLTLLRFVLEGLNERSTDPAAIM
jgi:hypothetical protein